MCMCAWKFCDFRKFIQSIPVRWLSIRIFPFLLFSFLFDLCTIISDAFFTKILGVLFYNYLWILPSEYFADILQLLKYLCLYPLLLGSSVFWSFSVHWDFKNVYLLCFFIIWIQALGIWCSVSYCNTFLYKQLLNGL